MSDHGRARYGCGTSIHRFRLRLGATDHLTAKADFKAAWERFYSSLTPEDIKSWHRTEDLAKTNAR
jgi:hypothetical protein